MADDTKDTPKKPKVRYTDKQIAAVLNKTRGMVYIAAASLGWTPKSLYRRLEKSPMLREVVESARGKLIDEAEVALEDAVLRSEAWAVCFTLKTIGKHRGYVERTEQEISGPDGGAVLIKIDR